MTANSPPCAGFFTPIRMTEHPTIRSRLLTCLASHTGCGISLDYICEQLEGPDLSREQIRNNLKALVKAGRLIRRGTIRKPIYQSLEPAATFLAAKLQARKPPVHVETQHIPTSPHLKSAEFLGVDWSTSISRPGCQDHLKYPSRRGDKRVMHRISIGA